MGRSPFAAKDLFPKAASARRRSTRIDFETPVILSGRDAAGQAFREETVTAIVNLHGAKIKTNYVIMVGMIVTLEVVRTEQKGKAVCVQVYEPPSGQTLHEVAVQLVQPGNIWGVENPPPDWETVESELGGRRHAATESNAKTTGLAIKPGVEKGATPSALRADTDAQLAELEKRAARLMDSVLDILRIQADSAVRNALQDLEKGVEGVMTAAASRVQERADQAGTELEATLETFRTEAMGEVVREALQGFQERLMALSAESNARMAQRADQAFADFEAALQTFRADLGDELAARREEFLKSVDQALRARKAEVAPAAPQPSAPLDVPQLNPAAKK
jgi:hypothetical protein